MAKNTLSTNRRAASRSTSRGMTSAPGVAATQNAVDAVGELEMRCVRLKAWLTAKLHRLGEVDMCEVTLGQVDMVNQAPLGYQ